jgi:hypothetical protein
MVYSNALIWNPRKPSIDTVIMEGGETHRVECEGDVMLGGTPVGTIRLVSALCVPSMRLHLCSGNQVTQKGATYVARGDGLCIRDCAGKEMFKGTKVGGL